MAIDQENAEKENLAPPSSELLKKSKEEPAEKFLVPKIVPEVENKVRKVFFYRSEEEGNKLSC